MSTIHYLFANVQGRNLFYREAGPNDAPAVVLLHGFPSSSFMFRDLIPRLDDRYHVIAPDYLGFGFSDAPPAAEFDYNFDALADLTAGLLDQLGIRRYAIYVQDYGAPIGWRLALRSPESISAIITQNGNAYEEGFLPDFWKPLLAYAQNQTPENEAAVRQAFTLETIRWQYLNGVPDETTVSPDTWNHDFDLISRPGNDQVQLALFKDYASNIPLYPQVHSYIRESHVPVLAVWGRNDGIFGPDGARAFATDQPNAEVHLLDGGHFLLESSVDEVSNLMLNFLGRVEGGTASGSIPAAG